MNWEAANVSAARRRSTTGQHGGDEQDTYQEQGSSSRRDIQQLRRATETVEACLSRLSKAYNVSILCIGELNKMNNVLQKQTTMPDTGLLIIDRLANAARTTLETAILLDPLIVLHSPTLNSVMDKLSRVSFSDSSDESRQRWKLVNEKRPPPPGLSSTAHKSTVRELGYLCLVNYADLLVSCCSCSSMVTNRDGTILDRGVVRTLSIVDSNGHSCWKGEPSKETQHLALTALCDASSLDGSDPSMWLKLACAARNVERMEQAQDEGQNLVKSEKYRRLQRYALERGMCALSPNVPPNPTVVRALTEFSKEDLPDLYPAILPPLAEKAEVCLDIPRYSWSVLGRMLVRACREGSSYQLSSRPQTMNRVLSVKHYGSPSIKLRLSPMLVLPTKVLGKICEFLERSSIWRFEATCRALSVSLVSARASMEQEKTFVREEDRGRGGESKPQLHDSSSKSMAVEGKNHGTDRDSNYEADRKADRNEKGEDLNQSHRSSKRLQSQLITSGKIAERRFRRTSVEYCFLSATLCTSKQEHAKYIKQLGDNKEISHQIQGKEFIPRDAEIPDQSRSSLNESSDRHRKEAAERLGSSSLSAFVKKWSGCNAGPMDLLRKFLGHVAMNVEDVFIFSSDPGGSVVLTSCLLGCFEACSRRNGYHGALVPRFFKRVSATGSLPKSLELFSIDLLHAELVLRQSDRYSPDRVEFDDDSNLISLMIPNLLNAAREIDREMREKGRDIQAQWALFRVRCNWLVACFFLWRSRISRVVSESREAEDEGVLYLDEAAKCFDSPVPLSVRSIQTPHLVSPGRSEAHWREISPDSIKKFRDEIQASSVVSLARQKFQDLQAGLYHTNQISQVDDLAVDDANALQAIGDSLFERYRLPHDDAEAKHTELVEDFLSVHGEELAHLSNSESCPASDLKLKCAVPLGSVKRTELLKMANPSIVSILITCLNTKEDNRFRVVELLARLVLATLAHQKILLERNANVKAMKRRQSGGTQSDDSDSESSLGSDGASVDRLTTNKNVDQKIACQCGHLVKLLLDRLTSFFSHDLSYTERNQIINLRECHYVIKYSLAFSSHWFHMVPRRASSPDDGLDLAVFGTVRNFVQGLVALSPLRAERLTFEKAYLSGMIDVVVCQQRLLYSIVSSQGNRTGRSERQRVCMNRAEFVGVIAGELGVVFSRNLARVRDRTIVRSDLLCFDSEADKTVESEDGILLSPAKLSLLCESLLSLWKYVAQLDPDNSSSAQAAGCTSFDRPVVRELQVPVVAAVVGLCGAAICTRGESCGNETGPQDQLALTEFFDSDASANDFPSDDEPTEDQHSQKDMLRAICHAVHCIDLVTRVVDEKSSMSRYINPKLGPLLPLVSVRVLNNFADMLLMEFCTDEPKIDKGQNLWSDEYPFGTRTTGDLLDSILHKSYRCLYGFTLVGEKDHLAAGKDPGSSMTGIETTTQQFVPESTSAAAKLYRCVVRAYAGGRRSPPKSALEIVSAALPPLEETAKSKALRSFLFTADNRLGPNEVSRLLTKDKDWEAPFVEIHSHLFTEKIEDAVDSEAHKAAIEEEIMMVRRGISSELARGALPVSSGDSGKSKSDSWVDDERLSTARHEEEISKKFKVILDDLCLSDVGNSEGWFRASQCLVMKADLIADRLGLSKGFTRSENFAVPQQRLPNDPSIPVDELEASQERESKAQENLQFLCEDLSLFVNHNWSSFSSLRECSKELGVRAYETSPKNATSRFDLLRFRVRKQLSALYQKGEFVDWQNAWGGLFVSALRQLAMRLLCVALYVVRTGNGEDVLISEVAEYFGVFFYSKLMASQSYGFPMSILTDHSKRNLALVSKDCFDHAVEALKPTGNDDESVVRATWDLDFMIGKCHEKIAKTYRREEFNPSKTRKFEKHMAIALEKYSKSLAEAKSIENDGGFLVEQAGGSAHGATEAFYRLHASRLKCLISAVSRDEDERGAAEAEALRLTERHWFQRQSGNAMSEERDIRDRVWDVVTDIVTAMAQCRIDQQFFHRSVYRHAQALMWAPVLCDPIVGREEGSLGTVPATRSYRLRGLNNSTNAANSASAIMGSLFDKKRPQLCAVWVTTTSASSPFQSLNNAIRKYDSLRGKYSLAYIESLRLCRRYSELESFLKWTTSCKRDLPSVFQATAQPSEQAPKKARTHDCLLLKGDSIVSMKLFPSIKRLANSALAYVIMQDLSDARQDLKRTAETHLKNAYACFLRLNCTQEELLNSRKWKYGNQTTPEVAALCQAYLALQDKKPFHLVSSGWSGGAQKSALLAAAIQKCRSLFPSLSGTFFSKKASSKPKQDDNTDPSAGSKRKSTAPIEGNGKSSFEVKVPEHLAAGSTFLTSVTLGGQTKKVKLTVPDGNPSSLRFTL